jgi:hypothetical protein
MSGLLFYSEECCGCCCGGPGGSALPDGPIVQTVPCPQESLQEACAQQAGPCSYSSMLRIIITILTIANPAGSTPEEIFDYHNNVLCPQVPLTLDEVSRLVRKGIRQGAIIRRNYNTGAVCVFGYFADLPSTDLLRKELQSIGSGPYYQLCLGVYADQSC